MKAPRRRRSVCVLCAHLFSNGTAFYYKRIKLGGLCRDCDSPENAPQVEEALQQELAYRDDKVSGMLKGLLKAHLATRPA